MTTITRYYLLLIFNVAVLVGQYVSSGGTNSGGGSYTSGGGSFTSGRGPFVGGGGSFSGGHGSGGVAMAGGSGGGMNSGMLLYMSKLITHNRATNLNKKFTLCEILK